MGLVLVDVVLFSLYPRWRHEMDDDEEEIEVKPFPSPTLQKATSAVTVLATLMALVAALWQHVALASTATIFPTITASTMKAEIGLTAMVLVWLVLGIWLIITTVLFFNVAFVFGIKRIMDSDSEEKSEPSEPDEYYRRQSYGPRRTSSYYY